MKIEAPAVPGVYVLYGESDLCIYVGSSKNMAIRIRGHEHRSKTCRVECFPCAIEELRDKEEEIIVRLHPTLNSSRPVIRAGYPSARITTEIPPIQIGEDTYYDISTIRNEVISLLKTMTSAELANKLGIAQQNISNFLHGKGVPKNLLEFLGYQKADIYREIV